MRYEAMTAEQMGKALEAYVVYHGGVHDEDCPCDDTCDCSCKWMNDGVNAACRVLLGLSAPSKLSDAAPAAQKDVA